MGIKYYNIGIVSISLSLFLSACTTVQQNKPRPPRINNLPSSEVFAARLPQHLLTAEKMVLVDPNVHAWGAYNAQGTLVRGGLAAAGANWCGDLHRRCHTSSGTFRVHSLGSADCKSHIFPIGHPGAPMPYCMFFSEGEALHGSYELADANVSHGCVRLRVSDAEWLRFNFVHVGTKVIVRPY